MATVAIPAGEVGKYKQLKERAHQFGSALLRLTQGVLVVTLAALLGRFLGVKYGPLISPDKNEELLKFSLCSAAGLSSPKEFLSVFPKFWDYVKDGKRDNLYDFSAFVLLTSITLAVASLGITSSKNAQPPLGQNSANPFVLFVQPSGRNTKFLVPFKKNAEGCDDKAAKFKEGLVWFDGTDKFMDQLAQGLNSCAISGRTVKVEIKGFASSADFKANNGQECANSNDLNVAIANLRATTVRNEMIRALGGSSGVAVTAKQWRNSEFSAMRDEALFNDRDANNQPVPGRGDLTRRADIVVTDVGDCEPKGSVRSLSSLRRKS